MYGTDTSQIGQILKKWKLGTNGYETRPDVIEQMVQQHGQQAVEKAVDKMILDHAEQPMGVDTQICLVHQYLICPPVQEPTKTEDQ